jgi:hypothetical protein
MLPPPAISSHEDDDLGQGGNVRVRPECPAPHRPWAGHVLEMFGEETMLDIPTYRSRCALTYPAPCKGEARAAALDFV